MAAVTSLGITFTTASGTKTVTATPAVNDLIVIVVAHTGNTAFTATPTDNNSDGLGAYTVIGSRPLKNSSADRMAVYVRNALVGSATSTVFTHAPGTTTGGGLQVLKVTGMTKTGANAALQSARQENQAGGATPAPVLAATPQSGNPIVGAVFNGTSPATMTPRTGYTERTDSGYSNPTTGLETMSLDSGETSATITWGGTSGTAWCSYAAELDTSTGLSQISGSSSGQASDSGTLVGAGALAGSATGVSADLATLTGAGALAGSVTGTTSASLQSGGGAIAGAVSGFTTASAVLTATGALAGNALGHTADTGVLAGSGILSGAVLGHTADSAVLTGNGILIGSVSGHASALLFISTSARSSHMHTGVANVIDQSIGHGISQ